MKTQAVVTVTRSTWTRDEEGANVRTESRELVELTIDCQALGDLLGRRAMRNSKNIATLADGAITARVI